MWHEGTLVRLAYSVALFKYKVTPKARYTEKWIRAYSDKLSAHGNYTKNPTALLYEKLRAQIPH